MTVSDTDWTGHFGSNRSDPTVLYTLLGLGFFQADTSDSAVTLIQEWVKSHPNAKVVPVIDYGSSPDGSRMLWVWLVDGESNLNQELVRAGACERATMAAPEELELLVTAAEYDEFEAGLPHLEALAKQDRLGIWK